MTESQAQTLLWIVPAAPLLAAMLTAMFGSRLRESSHWFCVSALAVSLLASVGLLWHCLHVESTVAAGYEWIRTGTLDVAIDVRVDALTAIMLVTVTLVSLLVAIYSSGYMHGETGYARYFAEVALFVFSMCMLVLANNLLVLFVFWEAVGLCSYLLIGFWFSKPSASAAAKKAFVVNRIGDFALLIGLFLIWRTFGTLDLSQVLSSAAINDVLVQPGGHRTIEIICFLLFGGAAGKSAQFPLHVWLPDAMEGPTPVSALIHAATMVTAGVYLVARCTPLYMHAPEVQMVVAGIGAFTALFAALIAVTQHDLKRVLAYSTVSQLGYMFLALGAASISKEIAAVAVTAAMFHLFTHAFFKALLFLCSGSVMHAMGNVIDMREFGGLRRIMPVTHATFLCGALALAGFPLLAGFWSKDEILSVVAAGTHGGRHATFFTILLISGIATAVLTAFYVFRAYFMTFWGPERFPRVAVPTAPHAGVAGDAHLHAAVHHAPHESPSIMTVPLMILALFALFVGLIFGPTGWFSHYLERTPNMPAAHAAHGFNWTIMVMGSLAALAGIGVAAFLYMTPKRLPEQLRHASGPLWGFSNNRFYIDELFGLAIVTPLTLLARLCTLIDRLVIDRFVEFAGKIPRLTGMGAQPMQGGVIPSYALLMLSGLVAISLAMIAMRP